ncbi:oxidoreductase [Bacillus sp. MUM 13]|uniref:oxidoreductase n=1 Tax=Bacillus sp. MUM 13 TaxID=1678001 RepID=UPI0008F57BA6|nr:oxidoreductase [Bacillus sp. MUM 13]OIK11821.1 oxidoreductase [Bacillus sp. MUM 13]
MNAIKTGLAGYGFSGATFHGPFLKTMEEFDIVKVMSSKPEKVREDLGDIEVVKDFDSLVDDPDIELIVITTPNQLHYSMAKKSLQHHKHVIIEKPMVIDPAEAEELIALAEENKLMLSVYHNRRWDNDFLTIKKLIAEGTLGEISTYEAHFDRFRPQVRDRWREKAGKGSGMLYDLGSHLIDQALHLFGEPQFVMADVFAQRENAETDDYFHIILGYETLRVILHSGSLVADQGPRYKVHGSKGSFIKFGIDCQEDDLKAGKVPGSKNWGKDKKEWYGERTVIRDGQEIKESVETVPGSYSSYYQGAAGAIREGKPSPVRGEDGLKTIKIIQAALDSNRQKRAVYLNGE